MEQHGKSYEPHILPNAQHAFFNDTRPSYSAAAVRESFSRLLEFFRRNLS